MCGIAGAISERTVVQILLETLKRLEYRGYDSAGLAIVDQHKRLQRVRRMGKVADLVTACEGIKLTGNVGIAHTRWATHGKPSIVNAHPHIVDEKIALVHNGVIENFSAIKEELIAKNYQFVSQTDTEVIIFLLHDYFTRSKDIVVAIDKVRKRLHGVYALAIIDTATPDKIFAVCQGCSLLIGLGIGENFLSSDVVALARFTDSYLIMESEEIAIIKKDSVQLLDARLRQRKRAPTMIENVVQATEKGEFAHYMLKEIYEQDQTIINTLHNRLLKNTLIDEFISNKSKRLLGEVQQVQIIACGTSMHAGLVARVWFEQLLGIPCQVEVASEYAHKYIPLQKGLLLLAISQSGETADTISAFKRGLAENPDATSIVICNVASSQLARLSKISVITAAGPEIGVASTKAFTAQLIVLLVLGLIIARQKNHTSALHQEIIDGLQDLPDQVTRTINETEKTIPKILECFVGQRSSLFLGRGILWPIALEGALKLKEISYIHAEAYPAGELKHGPLALIEEGFPVIALITDDALHRKMLVAIEEVASRGGRVIIFSNKKIRKAEHILQLLLPTTHPFLAPIIINIALQLLAYRVACARNHDVDQPRNLAKSVTVE